jgi:hypothetical protein
MDTADTETPSDHAADSYIRGGAGFSIDARKVGGLFVVVGLVAVLALAAALANDAAHKNTRDRRLTENGVPVTVTVTSCLGIASGTGITESSFSCRGSFELGAERYNEVIRGSSVLLQSGDMVHAVVDPASPATLSTVEAADNAHASWRAYLASIALVIGVVVVSGILMWSARRRRRSKVTNVPRSDGRPTTVSGAGRSGWESA